MLELSRRAISLLSRKARVSSDDMARGLPPMTNFAWAFMGQLVYAASRWSMLTVLAKAGTPEMVGDFALALAIATPVFLLANLELRAVQVTDVKDEYAFGDYLGLRLVTASLALVVIGGIAFATGYPVDTVLVILTIGLARAFESVSGVFYGLLQRYERMDRIAKSMTIKGLLSLPALAIPVYLTNKVFWGTLGLAVAWLVVLLRCDALTGRLLLRAVHRRGDSEPGTADVQAALRPRWEVVRLTNLARLALPLGVTRMLVSFNVNIPRYAVDRYLGRGELGLFAAMAYVVVAGSVAVEALGQSAAPRLARYYAAGNRAAFCRLLFRLLGIGALLGGASLLAAKVAGRQILTLLYRPEYATHLDAFMWVMCAAAISYVASFLGYGMTAARYFTIQLPLLVVVAASTALASLWLIPSQGLRGAAMALTVSVGVQAAGGLAIVAHALWALGRRFEGKSGLARSDRR